jgi:AcrR family transcriptional regulator
MPRERREQLILDVAGHVFARAGYDSASMDEIADRAGVSKPMLYTYFGSKEGLYLAYIERAGGELLERLVAAAPIGDQSAAGLRSRITEFLAFVEEHADGWRVLFREMAATRPLAEQVAGLRARIVEAIRRMIETAPGTRHTYAGAAADAIAHAIVGAGESLANWWLDHPELPRETVADWYLQVVRAVLAGPARSPAASPAASPGASPAASPPPSV